MKSKSVFALMPWTLAAMLATTFAKTLRVPDDYASIQAAINAATHGDTVLVAPGTYFENVKFRGKRIVVASHYLLNHDPALIRSTIINGGKPTHPDTASCVLIINREDSTAVLAGFTLTGGRGTRWLDEHGAGYYWEGGGVLTARSSPTIRDNFIVDNEAINISRATSAGGGGIRSGDAAPRIFNNVILDNRAMYGAGIVLNFCSGALVRNNVIAENRVDQAVAGAPTFGGGGIWINDILPGVRIANVIENNTLIGNSAFGNQTSAVAGQGGAFVFWNNALVTARNNILWANTQSTGAQIYSAGATLSLTYSVVEGGFPGAGNLAAAPAFAESGYYLADNSPGLDAGDPNPQFHDRESANAGQALWPSRGSLRNDIGAYGGPQAKVLADFSRAKLLLGAASYDFGNILPGNVGTLAIPLQNIGARKLVVSNTSLALNTSTITRISNLPFALEAAATDSLRLGWAPAQNGLLLDTLLLFTNDTTNINPQRILLRGNADPTPRLEVNTVLLNLGDLDLNLARVDTSFFIYNRGAGADSVYLALDYRGTRPPNAVSLTPAAANIPARDSLRVTFSVFPRIFTPPLLTFYSPRLIFTSRFSLGVTRFEKSTRFRIVGTLAVAENKNAGINDFRLEQNYPNPFSPPERGFAGPPSTNIKFTLVERGRVQLNLFNETGQLVRSLADGEFAQGLHELSWDGRNQNGQTVATGVYLYHITVQDQTGATIFSATRRMSFVK